MQTITPFLWFDDNAEEAVNLYVSLFKNSRIVKTVPYNDEAAKMSKKPTGSIMTIDFELEGQPFGAINGGPVYQFTPAISFAVDCKTQAEIDHYWDKLTEGGQVHQCGWLTDRFGITWQIVPAALKTMLADQDVAKTQRVMQAMFPMKKLDIATLEAAYNQ